MKILSTPSEILFIACIFAIAGCQNVSAQMGSIKAKQDEAAVLLRCYAEFTACPERKEYMIKMADYTECIGRQLNPANASTNCDTYRPKTDHAPNCPEDETRTEEATAFINNCTQSKGYNIPYKAGARTSDGSASTNSHSGGGSELSRAMAEKYDLSSEDQAKFNSLPPNQQALLGGVVGFADAIRQQREAKMQERESRQYGTKLEKDALLNEAAELSEKAKSKGLLLLLAAGGGYGFYRSLSPKKDSYLQPQSQQNVQVGLAVVSTFACAAGVGFLISKIIKSSRANELQRQANRMRVSFRPLIMHQQNGVVYNGIGLKLKF